MDRYKRQSSIIPNMAELKNQQVQLIGLGGIGSLAAVLLAKKGIERLILQDFDKVSDHNCPNSFLPYHHAEKKKVLSVMQVIKSFESGNENLDIQMYDFKFRSGDRFGGNIVISGVDSMEARQHIWTEIKNSNTVDLYIEARMGGQDYMVYPIPFRFPYGYVGEEYNVLSANTMEEVSNVYKTLYETTLYSSDKVIPVPCTEKAIIYNTASIGSDICNCLKRFICGQELPLRIFNDNLALERTVTWSKWKK